MLKFEKFAIEDTWSEKILTKKLKIWFFQFFLKQIILFLFEIEFYMKNAFFRGIACWNSSKITKFRNFAHIYPFFDGFSIFANFLGDFWKKIPKRGQMSYNWCQPLGKHDFWPKICSRAKIAGGGSWRPPCYKALEHIFAQKSCFPKGWHQF